MVTLFLELVGGAGLVTNVQNTKRIMISLPDYLLQEVDGVAEKENSNRSELIRQAMRLYLLERKKRVLPSHIILNIRYVWLKINQAYADLQRIVHLMHRFFIQMCNLIG